MKKRILSVFLAVITTVGMLTGCGSSSSGTSSAEKTGGTGKTAGSNLSFWSLFNGGDGEWIGKIVQEYNKNEKPEHPVQITTLVWDDYYTKLQTAIATGNGPDIGVSHVSKLYELAKTGAIEPLNGYLDKLGIKFSDYYAKANQDAVTVDGKIYAIPLDTHAEIMYYNTDLLKQAGVSEDAVKNIKSADDFVKILKTCKEKLPEDITPLTLTQSGDDPWRVWWANYYQMGGSNFVNKNGTKVTMDKDKAEKSMEWLKSLYDQKLILPGIQDHDMTFQNGKAVFDIGGTWVTGTFENTKGLHFGISKYPLLFGNTPYCWADSHTLILPKTNGRTEEESLAAVKFMFTASSKYGITWAGSGQIPAAKTVNTSDAYKKLPGYKAIDELKYAKYAPRTKSYYGGMKADMEQALDGYWQGQSSEATAYKQLYEAIQDNLDS